MSMILAYMNIPSRQFPLSLNDLVPFLLLTFFSNAHFSQHDFLLPVSASHRTSPHSCCTFLVSLFGSLSGRSVVF